MVVLGLMCNSTAEMCRMRMRLTRRKKGACLAAAADDDAGDLRSEGVESAY